MYQFTGAVKNEFRPEPGVNIVIKGLGDKIIQQPQHSHPIDIKQDGKTLTLIISASSGGTANRSVKVEVKDGAEKTTTTPEHWQVELTGASASTPCNAEITIVKNQ
jgi:hypothetical protein